MTALRALIWRRVDFRETSRLVTLVTAQGKHIALAKGAHRADSPFLGRLDFLNLVDATLSGRRSGLRLLTRVDLVHEPRALREPRRYLAACYLVELTDRLWFEARPDEELFDLLRGGLTLVERCPMGGLPIVVAGLELRLLDYLGTLPGLTSCSQCGRPLSEGPLHTSPHQGGLLCTRHRSPGSRRVPDGVLLWLAELAARPGRDWPGHRPAPDWKAARGLTGSWITASLERAPRARPMATAWP